MRVAIRRIETEFTVACKTHTYVNTLNNSFASFFEKFPSAVVPLLSSSFSERNFSISDTANFHVTNQFYFWNEKKGEKEEGRGSRTAQLNLSLNDTGNIDYYICKFVKKQIAARGQFLVTIFLQFQSSAKERMGETEACGNQMEGRESERERERREKKDIVVHSL